MIYYRTNCILKLRGLLRATDFNVYLQHECILTCCTDENFAADFESGSCQTLIRKTAQEQCLIFVDISLIGSKIRSCKNNLYHFILTIIYQVDCILPQLFLWKCSCGECCNALCIQVFIGRSCILLIIINELTYPSYRAEQLKSDTKYINNPARTL